MKTDRQLARRIYMKGIVVPAWESQTDEQAISEYFGKLEQNPKHESPIMEIILRNILTNHDRETMISDYDFYIKYEKMSKSDAANTALNLFLKMRFGNKEKFYSRLGNVEYKKLFKQKEKLQYLKIWESAGMTRSERYAKSILTKSELKPRVMAGNLILDDIYESTESFIDRDDQYGKHHSFDTVLEQNMDEIESELQNVRIPLKKLPWLIEYKKYRSSWQRYVILDDVLPEEVSINDVEKYNKFITYLISKSPTLQLIQSRIIRIVKLNKNKMDKTKKIYRGGSINELTHMLKNDGKVGCHKRQMQHMVNNDFVSASVDPNVALEFTSHDKIKKYQGMLMEIDISTDDDVMPVLYDIRGKHAQSIQGVYEVKWPTQKFNGFYTPSMVRQSEIQIKNGHKTKISRAWLHPMLEEKKKNLAMKKLRKLNPDVVIYQDAILDNRHYL